MPSIEELLGAVDRGDGPAEPVLKIGPLAQAMELRERMTRLQLDHDLRHGDIVRQKPGVGLFKEDSRVVLIVVRRLTDSHYDNLLRAEYVRENRLAMTAHVPDLVCGDVKRSNGRMMALDLYASVVLEPMTDDELLAWRLT